MSLRYLTTWKDRLTNVINKLNTWIDDKELTDELFEELKK